MTLWDLESVTTAAPGMYLLDKKAKTATLVVLWARVRQCDQGEPYQMVIALTIKDMPVDFPWDDNVVAEHARGLSTQIPAGYETIR